MSEYKITWDGQLYPMFIRAYSVLQVEGVVRRWEIVNSNTDLIIEIRGEEQQ